MTSLQSSSCVARVRPPLPVPSLRCACLWHPISYSSVSVGWRRRVPLPALVEAHRLNPMLKPSWLCREHAEAWNFVLGARRQGPPVRRAGRAGSGRWQADPSRHSPQLDTSCSPARWDMGTDTLAPEVVLLSAPAAATSVMPLTSEGRGSSSSSESGTSKS